MATAAAAAVDSAWPYFVRRDLSHIAVRAQMARTSLFLSTIDEELDRPEARAPELMPARATLLARVAVGECVYAQVARWADDEAVAAAVATQVADDLETTYQTYMNALTRNTRELPAADDARWRSNVWNGGMRRPRTDS